ncbi:hypothetical protein ACSYAD_19530 [Acaryochloris marina NIES-2412]|uniref:hypothetical protein n=1 Tax=Acaryochloris marina TaxID=155978 RepID=UPI004058C36F
MFSKLPDLFERNFAIGFFLPSIIFIVGNFWLLDSYDILPEIIKIEPSSQKEIEIIFRIALIVLFAWLQSIFILAANRDIIRFIEGYGGKLNPLSIFKKREEVKLKNLNKRIKILDDKYKECLDKKVKFSFDNERNKLLYIRATRYPEENFLLPTSFGNIVRAFERYSAKVYGLDAIPGWYRILTVVPEHYRDLVENAKSQVDFWVNTSFLNCVFLIEYFIVISTKKDPLNIYFSLFLIAIIIFAYQRAKSAAIIWGSFVKSIFDIFIPDLLRKLEFPLPASFEEEKLLWQQFSQMLIYHSLSSTMRRNYSFKNNKPDSNE